MALVLCLGWISCKKNSMGDLLHKKKGSRRIDTCDAFQTVKYHLRSRNITAVNYFSKCPLTDIFSSIRLARRKYFEDLKERSSMRPKQQTKRDYVRSLMARALKRRRRDNNMTSVNLWSSSLFCFKHKSIGRQYYDNKHKKRKPNAAVL